MLQKFIYERQQIILAGILILIFSGQQAQCSRVPAKDSVIHLIEKVNTRWQTTHPNPGNAFWDNAAYQTGNIEAYKITAKAQYRQYAELWATNNRWQGATSTNKSNWKYKYGESADYVLFGDWQICFQTYADLYNYAPDSIKIARAREVMEYEMSTSKNDYWWWADGLYMVMPVMTKLYHITGNKLYLDKLYEYFNCAAKIMHDSTSGLFYRDAKYIYPTHQTVNGKKDFWSRGDGWIFAGLAKVIQDLPTNYKHREYFLRYYKRMAKAIVECQQQEGYWTRSLLDPAHAPGYETSGTAFYTYGLLWGINHRILKEKKYTIAALKAWNYLAETAVNSNGDVGYIQPIGEKAIPGQEVNASSTANFGVGAFLLAASEMTRYCSTTQKSK